MYAYIYIYICMHAACNAAGLGRPVFAAARCRIIIYQVLYIYIYIYLCTYYITICYYSILLYNI